MTSPDGYDVEMTLRSGPTEADVIIRKYLRVEPDGTAFNFPLVPDGIPPQLLPSALTLALELFPRHRSAPADTGHHHHPLSDAVCHNDTHDPATADPSARHVFASVYVDPVGLLTMTPWMNLDAAQQIAEERRGVVVALPVVADFSTGPSMFSSGSWPAAKQTPEQLAAAKEAHARQQERERQIAEHRDRDPLHIDPPAAHHRDREPTRPFQAFVPPAGFTPGDGPPDYAVDDTHRPGPRPPFWYDPEDGAGTPFRVTEVTR